MDDDALMAVLDETAEAIRAALATLGDWGLAHTRPGQYRSDLVADAAALEVLDGGGLGVLSEESGARRAGADVVVVVDPLDGSTNASRGIPWFATSLCAVDADGARAALVVDLVAGHRFSAVRGRGAWRDGEPLVPSGAGALSESVVAVSGFPPRPLGWRQYRALGAAALDLCAVASGVVDAYVDCSVDAHGPWDYLGGALVCQEAGAGVVDGLGRDLLVLDHGARRTPVAAANPVVLDELLAARHAAFADVAGSPGLQ